MTLILAVTEKAAPNSMFVTGVRLLTVMSVTTTPGLSVALITGVKVAGSMVYFLVRPLTPAAPLPRILRIFPPAGIVNVPVPKPETTSVFVTKPGALTPPIPPRPVILTEPVPAGIECEPLPVILIILFTVPGVVSTNVVHLNI